MKFDDIPSAFFIRMDEKIDSLRDDNVDIKLDQAEIRKTLAVNTESLIQHMARTSALEDIVKHNKSSADVVKVDVASIYTVLNFSKWLIGSSLVITSMVSVIKWIY